MTTEFTTYNPLQLPPIVLSYLDAHDEGRYADAHATFASTATVIDDGHTYQGAEAIARWLEKASGEYEYTSTRIAQDINDNSHPTLQIRLDGTFPGGTVTLRYQFELEGDLITRLEIDI